MFERARLAFKPDDILYLLVAEAPPSRESGRFFYYESVSDKDSLFHETMKVLYPREYTTIKDVRFRKRSFLRHFMEDGYYLVDAGNEPMSGFTRAQKLRQLRRDLPDLIHKIKPIISEQTKIILISATVYEVCSEPLKIAGMPIINTESIDFPGSGGQKKFRSKLMRLLGHNHSAVAELAQNEDTLHG